MATRPTWSRRGKHALIATLVVTIGMAAAVGRWLVRRVYFFPRSDAAVVTSAGFWPYQDALNVEQLDVVIEESRFGFMNTGEALVALRIAGRLKPDNRAWQPTIKAVQITERVVGEDEDRYVDVEVVPIIEEREVAESSSREFDVTVEHVVHEIKWGENRFVIHCEGQARTVSALCSK